MFVLELGHVLVSLAMSFYLLTFKLFNIHGTLFKISLVLDFFFISSLHVCMCTISIPSALRG